MKNDFIMPIAVLTLICLVISGALALTNNLTEPIIAEAAAQRSETARNEIIPEATGFILMDTEGLPATVKEVYKSENGVGFIFMLETGGYGGDMKLICGIGPDGRILQCMTLEHAETKGLGARIQESSFSNQFNAKDSTLDGVSAISGATISSSAYISAIHDAFTAFEIVKGVG